MVDLLEEEQTYCVTLNTFSSTENKNKMTAEDLTTLTFIFPPVAERVKILDLTISEVKFTKSAGERELASKIETFENTFIVYPNPSKYSITLLFIQ